MGWVKISLTNPVLVYDAVAFTFPPIVLSRTDFADILLTSGKLNTYLVDIDRQAQERFERLIEGIGAWH